MKPKSPKTAAEDRKWSEERRKWVDEVGHCMLCHSPHGLVVHEILRGRNRRKAMPRRECCLVLCDYDGYSMKICHPIVQDWPLADQLALKLFADRWWFDLDVIREVKGSGGIIVTVEDVREAGIKRGFLR